MAIPTKLTSSQLTDIQGDVWSKGFPKFYETYYFFTIKQPKDFTRCLPALTTGTPHKAPLISNLEKVHGDHDYIKSENAKADKEAKATGQPKKEVLFPLSNALIAFTRKGLDAIQAGLSNPQSLDLSTVKETDPAFFDGMQSERIRATLHDPFSSKWDALFRAVNIHGLLKIGGSSKEEVEKRLNEIQVVLRRGTVIEDVLARSPPTSTDSRVDGWTRPNKNRGKEHFGFEDSISQPKMDGIDELEPPPDEDHGPEQNMNTDPHLLIVTENTWRERMDLKRPKWMHNGSFLVFRKLEQNVKDFDDLTEHWKEKNCYSKAHMGAKLMGRWQSGAPLANPNFSKNDSKDLDTAKTINDFGFWDQVCPVSAHIRKTNPRKVFSSNDVDQRGNRTRIIRNGIPYGSEYKGHENDSKRGLLFACYQGHIEDGFQHMQADWSNEQNFLNTPGTGHDPIIGQVEQTKDGENGELTTSFTDKTDNPKSKQTVTFQQLVTLKGGEYFFVPSIKALGGELAKS